MARQFPERRERDDALIVFILGLFNTRDVSLLREWFGLSDREIKILGKKFFHQKTYGAIGSESGLDFPLSGERGRAATPRSFPAPFWTYKGLKGSLLPPRP